MPETRYTKSGGVNIAFQVVGDGPLDLVYVPGWVSNVELMWEEPTHERFLRRLASFSRLVLFDKRGTGLSDRVGAEALPTLEERVDDVRAVMDAAGVERAALFGFSEGGNLSTMFAASNPERTVALAIFGTFAKRIRSDDYPWAPTRAEREAEIARVEREWGRDMDLDLIAPSVAGDEAFKRRLTTYFRRSASPGAAAALLRMNSEIDVRAILPTIRVPTLVLHRRDDGDALVDEGRFIASRIPGARLVELPGADHIPWVGDQEAVLAEVEEFLTGSPARVDDDRVLATLLFTDVVDSTAHAARLGDAGWRDAIERHHAAVRRQLARWGGREVDAAGDGFFASFTGPARAVRCALAAVEAVGELGFVIRAGVHTGEVERAGDELRGIAVHVAARVAAAAGPAEVLVSQTVKDLVAGSGLAFEERGERELKGVPGRWRLHAARP